MTQWKKDRYGAVEIGMAVEKPKQADEYRFNATIAKVYKKSIAEAVGNAVYEAFDFEEAQIDGKQVVQIRLAAVPYDEYQRLKRKAASNGKSKKSSKTSKSSKEV